MAGRATFYFDFSSPYAYLAAERISGLFAEAKVEQPEWQPISFGYVLKASGRVPWSMQPEGADPRHLEEIARRAAERGLPEVRYDEGWPAATASLIPTRAAIFAKEAGKVVSFSQAALRQRFAAGRDLSEIDNVLIAAAACELHPRAVIKGIETKSVKDRLTTATEEAIAIGLEGIPTVAVNGELFWGDDRLEDAVAAASLAAD